MFEVGGNGDAKGGEQGWKGVKDAETPCDPLRRGISEGALDNDHTKGDPLRHRDKRRPAQAHTCVSRLESGIRARLWQRVLPARRAGRPGAARTLTLTFKVSRHA